MMRMLVTRPEPDAEATAGRLAALDIEPVLAPLLDRVTNEQTLPGPEGFDGIVATSANALDAIADRDALLPWLDRPLYAVGDRTAAVAEALGFETVLSADGGLADLAAMLRDKAGGRRLFYPRGRDVAGDLAAELAGSGIELASVIVYEMRPVEALPEQALTALHDGDIAAVLFHSRRTAETFVTLAERQLEPFRRQRLVMLCMSARIAEPLLEAGYPHIALADRKNEEAMLALALSFVRGQLP